MTFLYQLKCFCFSSLLLFTCTSELFSQSKIKGNREVKMEQTSVSDFHSINIGNDFDVVLVKSTYPSVTLEADENLHPIVQYEVNDSILDFRVSKIVKRSKEFKVYIRYTEPLKNIHLSGDVDVETQNPIQLKALHLKLKDDAKIEADVVADTFTLENNNNSTLKLSTNCVLNIEGKHVSLKLKQKSNNSIEINSEDLNITTYDKADLDIEGFSYNLNVKASGSSQVNAKDLLSNISKVKVSEKTNASIQATDSINIEATGSSKIELYGTPKINIDKMTGTAIIEKKEI